MRLKRYAKNVTYAKYIQNYHHYLFSLPLPLEFQERIAMNLKIYSTCNGHIILIDLCTRLSAATIIPNKNTQTVMKHVFHYGYLYMGHLKRFS